MWYCFMYKTISATSELHYNVNCYFIYRTNGTNGDKECFLPCIYSQFLHIHRSLLIPCSKMKEPQCVQQFLHLWCSSSKPLCITSLTTHIFARIKRRWYSQQTYTLQCEFPLFNWSTTVIPYEVLRHIFQYQPKFCHDFNTKKSGHHIIYFQALYRPTLLNPCNIFKTSHSISQF